MPPLSQEALQELRDGSFDDLVKTANLAIIRRDAEALPQIADLVFDLHTNVPPAESELSARYGQLFCAIDVVLASEQIQATAKSAAIQARQQG